MLTMTTSSMQGSQDELGEAKNDPRKKESGGEVAEHRKTSLHAETGLDHLGKHLDILVLENVQDGVEKMQHQFQQSIVSVKVLWL